MVGSPEGGLLQEDLDALYRWTVEWDLPLNMGKCHRLLPGKTSAPPRWVGTDGTSQLLYLTQEVRDLGVMVTSDFRHSTQCTQATQKAYRAVH